MSRDKMVALLGSTELAAEVYKLLLDDGPSEDVLVSVECRGVSYWGQCPTCNGSLSLWDEVFTLEIAALTDKEDK